MIVRMLSRTFLLAAALSASGIATQAVAQQGATIVNVSADGLALQGYDPVAYFVDAKPVRGTAEFTAVHQGATYRFASAEHRARFVASPGKYTPQFGGYCAMGVAVGKKLDADPTLWRVVDGKLYLNVNKDAQAMWLKDPAKHIATASAKWDDVAARKGFDRM